jgi:hypothetical protein
MISLVRDPSVDLRPTKCWSGTFRSVALQIGRWVGTVEYMTEVMCVAGQGGVDP